MNKLYFFPRERRFWVYHCSALLLTAIIQALLILAWRDQKLFNVVGSLWWLLLYTLGVLSFRWHYRRRDWHRLGTGKLIPLALIYALVIGFLVTLLMLALTLPFFWEQLFAEEKLQQYNTSVKQQLTMLLVGNTSSTHMFSAAWMFIYITVTTSRRMRDAEFNNLRLENSLKEARLTSLTNQLNPHFLFNSLNNIRFMIHENPGHADRTITALSEILRYSLESGRRDKVALIRELEVVERYLEVMALQLEQRLDARVHIAEVARQYLVPPMCLQLLVENAVKHGIENRKNASRLEVSGWVDAGKLHLSVSNPRPDTPCAAERNTGTGLANIEQRLHLLYGERAQLRVDGGASQFTVTLILPAESASEAHYENPSD